jgi:GNAT superfamily N-acetyltransferase
MIELKVIGPEHGDYYGKRLQELEKLAEYPYGNDFFRIDHGPSYFRFFERLGHSQFNVAIKDDKIIGCGAAILRSLPQTRLTNVRAWYLCDLKVHPDYRGLRIPAQLFRKSLFMNYLRCSRAYAISMDQADGQNRVVKLLDKFPYFPIRPAGKLRIYGVGHQKMKALEMPLCKIVGPISYLSLSGKKDLIMKSTGDPLDVLHVQHGPLAEHQQPSPRPGAVHMLCAPAESALDTLLRSHQEPSAQATILAHRLPGMDWGFILTSDI